MKDCYRLLPGRSLPFVQTLFLILLTLAVVLPAAAQRGFNYYKDPTKVGSPNEKAYAYFKKAYYDHIWQWSKAGADSAEYYLKLAIQEDSTYAAAYAFLGHVYQFKTYDNVDFDKKLALQKQCAEKSLSFHPRTGDAYSLMSDVKWHEKDTAQALALLQKAIAMEPDNVGNYLFIAVRFTQAALPDSAIVALHKLMLLDPEYGQAFMKLGTVYSSINRFDSAKYYFKKAINHYHTIVPKDNRMLGGYYWLADVFKKEAQYDSAVYYYSLFRREVEATDLYFKDAFLSWTYKALYECHDQMSKKALRSFVDLNERRIAANPKDAKLGLDILVQIMTTDSDSLIQKHGLPLARHLQSVKAADPYIHIYSALYEYDILRRFKRSKEAMTVLEALYAKEPRDPLTLFEMGRMNILANKSKQGIAFLQQSKSYLNGVLTKKDFVAELKHADFDKVRNMPEFKKLSE